MRIRRCAILLIEPREQLDFSLESLCNGGDGIDASTELLALAPHLGVAIPIDGQQAEVLYTTPASKWSDRAQAEAAHGASVVAALVVAGLLIADDAAGAAMRERDDAMRAANWHAHSAVAHFLGRWSGVTSGEELAKSGVSTMSEMFERLGPPPAHVRERVPAQARRALPAPRLTHVDELLARRATCRNFDPVECMDLTVFSAILHRVFGAQAVHEIHAGNVVLKRNAPSGGGLHPIEAYVVVQRVAGIAPGLYHYHPVDHALEPLPAPDGGIPALARTMVASQEYFADAPVFVVMAARFGRSQWKYRNHSKIHRAVMLEAGHFSQNLYLSATEFALGAFVTAAINEVEIEHAFGLDPLEESPIAVLGFGRRAATCEIFEFDPNHKVWPEGVTQPR